MAKRLMINVTEEDIRRGLRESPSFCPVARAIKRDYPDAIPDPSVAGRYIRSEDDYYIPSARGKAFIRKFDLGKDVGPIRFTATLIRAHEIGMYI